MTIKMLSSRQKRILDFLRVFLQEHSYPPTVRDIQQGCRISSTSVVDYNLRLLQNRGYLRRDPEVSRGLELLEEDPGHEPIINVPLIGYIAAGQPVPVPATEGWGETEPMDTLPIPQSIAGRRNGVYALRVRGQSMIDALIDDGDIVILEPAIDIQDGETAAVWLTEDKEATLKRIYREGPLVRLQPANSQMNPILVDASKVEIQGRVVAVIRSLGFRR